MVVRPFTDLLRQPNDVARDVESGAVVLRRRGAPDLRLTRADREAERTAVVAGLTRALRSLAGNGTRIFQRALEDAFPWSGALPAGDRRTFGEEVSRLLAAGADLDTYGAVTQLIAEWRSTAAVHADRQHPRQVKRRRTASASDASTSSG